MRYLFLLVLLFTACNDNSKIRSPKFSYKQEVVVTKGFYKGLSGKLDTWRLCSAATEDDSKHNTICYTIIIEDEKGNIGSLNDVIEEALL